MTNDQAQQNLQRNKIIAQTSERVVSQLVQLIADGFRALLKFIQEMIAQVMSK